MTCTVGCRLIYIVEQADIGDKKEEEDYGKSILADIDVIIQYLCAHDTASTPFHI